MTTLALLLALSRPAAWPAPTPYVAPVGRIDPYPAMTKHTPR